MCQCELEARGRGIGLDFHESMTVVNGSPVAAKLGDLELAVSMLLFSVIDVR